MRCGSSATPASEERERASLPWRALLGLLGRLPQAAMSRGVGRLADIPLARPLRSPVLGLFSRVVGIDRSEAELPLDEYGSVNAYFVRRLRPGVREWPTEPGLVGSPVDGFCGQLGRIRDGKLVQAKGLWYTAAELLDDEAEAERYEGGSFMTIYLSPRDYHRIHAPLGGSISRARHIPGALFPVNPPGVLEIPDLFPRNERLICYLDTELGRAAVVAVGATNVGRISTAFDPRWNGSPESEVGEPGAPAVWVTNRRDSIGATHEYSDPIGVSLGEEIMAFHLGSTVVLLFESSEFRFDEGLSIGSAVRLGQVIGSYREG